MIMSVIRLEGICKEYKNKVIFSDFNMEVEKGEFLTVSGKSGAGKTTLLNIIGLLEKPDRGTVSILGHKNPNLNKRDGRLLVRDHIGYLFQNFALIENYTAKQNIDLVCKIKRLRFSDSSVQNILAKLGISDLMDKKIFRLSGGEQQRIVLARLSIKKPDILLADEPTTSLDPENAEMVMRCVSDLNKDGTTVILVTHNPDIVKLSQKSIQIG